MGNRRKRKRGQKVGAKKANHYRRFWDPFFERMSKSLLSYARKLGNSEDQAREILQKVFVAISTGAQNPVLITNHGAYLKTVTRNVHISQFRDSRNIMSLEDVITSELPESLVSYPTDQKMLEATEAVLKSAAGKNAHKALLTFQLYFIEGYTVQEIAEKLGEKPSRTRFRLAQTCKRVRSVIAAKPRDEKRHH